jgi:hypothetical protein
MRCLCCAVLCCAVLCRAVPCCAVLCCAQAAEQYLRSSGLRYTVVRPGGLSDEAPADVGRLIVSGEDTLFGLDTDPGRAISRDTVSERQPWSWGGGVSAPGAWRGSQMAKCLMVSREATLIVLDTGRVDSRDMVSTSLGPGGGGE